MAKASHSGTTKRSRPTAGLTKTTLYELVEMIGHEVDEEDDQLISGIIVYLVDSGKIKLIKKRRSFVAV
ncbi:MAG: hypothetical protein JXD19_01405 [Deltaproteobacteria bacterium]|nr:hypothetical protein [Deltaproteobacteria bacterium]